MAQVRHDHPNWTISWLDHLQRGLHGAFFPWWLPLLLLPLLFVSVEIGLILMAGGWQLLVETPLIMTFSYAALPSYLFAFLQFLDRRAEAAVQRLESVIKEGHNLDELSRTISNMPRWPALLATSLGFILFFSLRAVVDITGDIVLTGTIGSTRWIRLAEGVIFWMLNGLVVYHSIRQLSIIDHIFTEHVRIDLFNQSPLYDLASVATYTALGFALPVSLIYLVVLPRIPTDPLSLGLLLLIASMSIFILVAPVYRLHRQLEKEKSRRLMRNSNSMDSLLAQFHAEVEENEGGAFAQAEAGFNVLNAERVIIQRTPTWPWSPGSIRGILAALLLPTIVWLIQQLLELVLE